MARALLLILIFLTVFFMANKQTIRGIRNNNPLNIRKGNNWKGETSTSQDAEFESFTHHKYGFRAGARVLRTYQNHHGLYTIKEMIHRFAPPNENNTHNYAGFVAGKMGVSVDERIDLSDSETLARMLHVMSIMEVGKHYTIEDARAGVALA
ncbi:structural protein [Vibrio nigripulchritudo]|uniref:structural protein n=1 Tax=Vibrio nigripulchritudo TaxID=28173 RepID=UPI0024920456|nr:structural protein [Vibrio nigripulchritudo]BDU42900.1 hypothetical protein TUMSATVNIG3_16980 [Vibrio nigripulchritudo]